MRSLSPLHLCTGRRPICTFALSLPGPRVLRSSGPRIMSPANHPVSLCRPLGSLHPARGRDASATRPPRPSVATPSRPYPFLPPVTWGCHLPPETMPLIFAPMHRSSAPICTFALHVLPPCFCFAAVHHASSSPFVASGHGHKKTRHFRDGSMDPGCPVPEREAD